MFGTTLSEEYQIASQTFSLSLEEMWKISLQTLDYGFMSPSEREMLMRKWQNWFEKKKNLIFFGMGHVLRMPRRC